MIKECKVILRNSIHMVVMFGDTEIQMVSDGEKHSTVYVKYEKEIYSIVGKNEYDKFLASLKKLNDPIQ